MYTKDQHTLVNIEENKPHYVLKKDLHEAIEISFSDNEAKIDSIKKEYSRMITGSTE